MDCGEGDTSAVRVAVRVRPQSEKERFDNNQTCVNISPDEPQIWIGETSFTFDTVFGFNSSQQEIFNSLAKPLVDGLMLGYNATIFAYGQTGSGKTYTMGTSFESSFTSDEAGIIPRAIEYLFGLMNQSKSEAKAKGRTPPEFQINAQFLEIYNEKLIDLLNTVPEGTSSKQAQIQIHRNTRGNIYLTGATTRLVSSPEDTLACLRDGSMVRSTGSTLMNTSSSRSHAIFTLFVRQEREVPGSQLDTESLTGSNKENCTPEQSDAGPQVEMERLTAKFHFVDLAGSERLKRTGATGNRAKEGIAINCGLFALGNVISALGDQEKKGCYVPYRGSKLTRLLQDSLGGNSRTIMMACISPADVNFLETLNTLNYANRAKNIQNRITVNQDKASKQLSLLRREVVRLKEELEAIRQGRGDVGTDHLNDLHAELAIFRSQAQDTRLRLDAQLARSAALEARNCALLADLATLRWMADRLERAPADAPEAVEAADFRHLIENYTLEAEQLRSQLAERDAMLEVCKRRLLRLPRREAPAEDSEWPPEEEWASKRLNTSLLEGLADKAVIQDSNAMDVASFDGNLDEEDGDESDTTETSGDASEVEEQGDKESHVHQELASVEADINHKQLRLASLQAKMQALERDKLRYAHKCQELTAKIRMTEEERDQELAKAENNTADKMRHLRDAFEKKLGEMKRQIQEYSRARQDRVPRHEEDIRRLRTDLQELRKRKLDLARQLRDASRQLQEAKRAKVIADTQIRRLKDSHSLALRRKNEEITQLKREQRLNKPGGPASVSQPPVSRITSRRPPVYPGQELSATGAKLKWEKINNLIDITVKRRQTVESLQRDLTNWAKERELISQRIADLRTRQAEADAQKRPSETSKIQQDVASATAQLQLTQDAINECKESLIELESQLHPRPALPQRPRTAAGAQASQRTMAAPSSSTAASASLPVPSLLDNVTLGEARHLLHHFYEAMIEQALELSHAQAMESQLRTRLANRELMAAPASVCPELLVVDQTLRASSETINLCEPNVVHDADCQCGCQGSSDSSTCDIEAAPLESLADEHVPALDETFIVKRKPRVTFTLSNESVSSDKSQSAAAETALKASNVWKRLTHSSRTSISPLPGQIQSLNATQSNQIPSIAQSSSDARLPPAGDSEPQRSKSLASCSYPRRASAGEESSTGSMALRESLICTHIAQGHTNAVLDVDVCGNNMLTGSKDRSAKLWDLESMRDLATLSDHPNNVSKVCLHPAINLFFTVCTYFVRVWDLRDYRHSIRTLLSSGELTSREPDMSELSMRQNVCPSGEAPITDLAIGPGSSFSHHVYMATGNVVRIWDLRREAVVAKLSSGTQATVRALGVADAEQAGAGERRAIVATGSKDHYVKAFEVDPHACGLYQPRWDLEPPHYDGVECVALLRDRFLFSGSRDCAIKKWSLQTGRPVGHISKAHKNIVQSLAVSGDEKVLASGCKTGQLKLWSVEDLQLVADNPTAHEASINSVKCSGNTIYTASSDKAVKFWKRRSR